MLPRLKWTRLLQNSKPHRKICWQRLRQKVPPSGPVYAHHQDIDFVEFGRPSVENTTAQAKLDAWLFPFMNVYVSVGTFDGDGVIPLALEGRDLLEFLGLGRLCGGVLEPAFCSRILSAVAEPEYTGEALTLGMNLAMGWDDYFVTLPISHA